MKKILAMVLCLALVVGLLSGCSGEMLFGAIGKKIALITPDHDDWYWTSLEAGAMNAASELEIEIVRLPSDAEDDVQMAEQIHNAVSSGCRAIVIAANDSDAVTVALQEAASTGVKIICVGVPAEAETEATFATDHQAAGKLAGETMLSLLEEWGVRKGSIGIINGKIETASARQREAGFREAFEGTAYTLLETQYTEGGAAEAQRIAESCIAQKVVGIFGCTEALTVGAGNAAGETGARVCVVGVGASETVLNLLEQGGVRAVVQEKPDIMGYEGVKAAAAVLKGEKLNGAVTDTGVSVLKSEAPVVVSNDFKIALIAMDSIDWYWASMEEGAMKAAAELECEVINMSPNIKDDEQQIEQINNAVAADCDAIVIAAIDPDSVCAALEEADAAGVTIIYVDSPANVQAAATFSTDNHEAGRTAGETMLAALEEWEITEGTIGIINVSPENEAGVQREAGFREVFEGKDYTLLETEYSEGDAAQSHAIAESYIRQDVVGIFCCNEGATNGTGNAVRAKHADTLVVGFGVSDAIMEMIDEGYILATMTQMPDVMGYEAVKAACAALRGENLEGTVTDTGVAVLTQE